MNQVAQLQSQFCSTLPQICDLASHATSWNGLQAGAHFLPVAKHALEYAGYISSYTGFPILENFGVNMASTLVGRFFREMDLRSLMQSSGDAYGRYGFAEHDYPYGVALQAFGDVAKQYNDPKPSSVPKTPEEALLKKMKLKPEYCTQKGTSIEESSKNRVLDLIRSYEQTVDAALKIDNTLKEYESKQKQLGARGEILKGKIEDLQKLHGRAEAARQQEIGLPIEEDPEHKVRVSSLPHNHNKLFLKEVSELYDKYRDELGEFETPEGQYNAVISILSQLQIASKVAHDSIRTEYFNLKLEQSDLHGRLLGLAQQSNEMLDPSCPAITHGRANNLLSEYKQLKKAFAKPVEDKRFSLQERAASTIASIVQSVLFFWRVADAFEDQTQYQELRRRVKEQNQ